MAPQGCAPGRDQPMPQQDLGKLSLILWAIKRHQGEREREREKERKREREKERKREREKERKREREKEREIKF